MVWEKGKMEVGEAVVHKFDLQPMVNISISILQRDKTLMKAKTKEKQDSRIMRVLGTRGNNDSNRIERRRLESNEYGPG